jgi:glycosyltransferase involved in cell wall biosynthesis
VPSRQETYLPQTVTDLLAKAGGDVEVLVILDGYWANPPLPADKRIRILHRGTAQGLRAATNAAVQMSTGEYLLKCDAHTMWAPGYDIQLKADCHEDNWVLVPRRYALNAEQWAWDETNAKYPIDYHSLSTDLHGVPWVERRAIYAHRELDDEMSSQGSAWFMSRKCWDWLGPQDIAAYGPFYREFQEVGLKAWLSGGAVKVTKRTWYAHLRKKDGRGYSMDGLKHEEADAYCSWFWLTDQPYPQRQRNISWLIDHFWPVPGWPADFQEVLHRARRDLKSPYQVAA